MSRAIDRLAEGDMPGKDGRMYRARMKYRRERGGKLKIRKEQPDDARSDEQRNQDVDRLAMWMKTMGVAH